MASYRKSKRSRSSEERKPVFWKELYCFACICLAGCIVALAVLPPKARRYWSLLQIEARLTARNAELDQRIERLKQAAYSMETDDFYREAAIRVRLGVKKKSEEFLERRDRSVR